MGRWCKSQLSIHQRATVWAYSFFFLHYFSINLSTKHIHGTGFDVPVMDYFPASIHLFESTVQGSTSLCTCWTYLLTFTQHINYQPTKPIYQSILQRSAFSNLQLGNTMPNQSFKFSFRSIPTMEQKKTKLCLIRSSCTLTSGG